jgi:hypothetical protein
MTHDLWKSEIAGKVSTVQCRRIIRLKRGERPSGDKLYRHFKCKVNEACMMKQVSYIGAIDYMQRVPLAANMHKRLELRKRTCQARGPGQSRVVFHPQKRGGSAREVKGHPSRQS